MAEAGVGHRKSFDYIVIGAGTAGCVLANKLSERPDNTVLLIEIGRDILPGQEPAIVLDTYPRSASEPSLMWPDCRVEMTDFASQKDPPLSQFYVQGRGMGGSGTLMGMWALRGHPDDYDEWRNLGAQGWGWQDVLPYFIKLERDVDFQGPLHGTSGPIAIRRHPREQWPPFCQAVDKYLETKGYPFVADMNTDFSDGVAAIPMSNEPGRRLSSAIAYLDQPTRARKNLTVLCETSVEQILFEGKTAVGVRTRSAAGINEYRAREVIVSAGAFQSPAILLRSGVGPAEQLKSMGLAVVANRAGVGRNLLNHPLMYLATHLKPGARQTNEDPSHTFNCLRYSSGIAGCGEADMLFMIINKASWHAVGQRIASIGVSIYQAFSAGDVTLVSPDPDVPVRIRLNMLADERDLVRMVDAFRFGWDILNSPQVRAIANEIFLPTASNFVRRLGRPIPSNALKARLGATLLDGPGFIRRQVLEGVGFDPSPLFQPDSDLAQFVKESTEAMFHTVGTCRIGQPDDPKAVVDPECRVIGVSGLRVVDASIMPTVVRGNTNLPTVMIAEKASAMILAEQNQAAIPQTAA